MENLTTTHTDNITHTPIITTQYLPVQAKIVWESFAGMDETTMNMIVEAYGNGCGETALSAGLDLRYVGMEPLTIRAGEQAKIHTGLSIYLQDPRWVGIIVPRSGLGTKGLVLGNLIGIIDADYQQELLITAWNRHTANSGNDITIEPGERIAQYLVIERMAIGLTFVEEYTETTGRTGGFGHTGRF